MARGLHPAATAHSDARCFLGHLSKVSSPWCLAWHCFLAGQVLPDHICSSRGCSRKRTWVCLTVGVSLTLSPGRGWLFSL